MENLLMHDLPEVKNEIAVYQPKRDLIPKSASDIRHMIMTIRGRQILLDRDLAELYGVSTKVLNQAVKRNLKRFPDGYMFQLAKVEIATLRSQIVTSNLSEGEIAGLKMGLRRAPYAFTERGLYMLATVLNSDRAKVRARGYGVFAEGSPRRSLRPPPTNPAAADELRIAEARRFLV